MKKIVILLFFSGAFASGETVADQVQSFIFGTVSLGALTAQIQGETALLRANADKQKALMENQMEREVQAQLIDLNKVQLKSYREIQTALTVNLPQAEETIADMDQTFDQMADLRETMIREKLNVEELYARAARINKIYELALRASDGDSRSEEQLEKRCREEHDPRACRLLELPRIANELRKKTQQAFDLLDPSNFAVILQNYAQVKSKFQQQLNIIKLQQDNIQTQIKALEEALKKEGVDPNAPPA